MRKASALSLFVTLVPFASSTLAFESLRSSRAVLGWVTVTDRVKPQWCGIGIGPIDATRFSFDDLCSVDTGYGYGRIDAEITATREMATFRASGAITSDVLCSNGDPWGGDVDMRFDWESIEEFRLDATYELHLEGQVTVGYSLDPEYGRVEILGGTDFADVVWSRSIPEGSSVTFDERIRLEPGDYRWVFVLHTPGGSTCDLVGIDFDVTATLATAVSVVPRTFGSIKELYREPR